MACEQPSGTTEDETDCDDTDAALKTVEADADGTTSCAGDCDDNDAGFNLEDAYIYDPLIEKKRTIVPYDRGGFRLGYRQDIPERNLSFGLNYQDGFGDMGGTGGNRVQYDIDNVVFCLARHSDECVHVNV